MTGVYKITSPTGRIYIGQAWDIKIRWRGYRKMSVSRQPYIAKSIIKYGVEAHTFEVIHELPADVTQDVLDRYEQLYMDLYKYAGFSLMNIRGAGSRGKVSEETKEKLRLSRLGTTHTIETKITMSTSRKGRIKTEEHRMRIGASNLGKTGSPGEKNPKAKLTPTQVFEIRSKHTPNKKRGNLLLAKEYGVSISTIERINSRGKSSSWSHL